MLDELTFTLVLCTSALISRENLTCVAGFIYALCDCLPHEISSYYNINLYYYRINRPCRVFDDPPVVRVLEVVACDLLLM